jgi:hypothetical protein
MPPATHAVLGASSAYRWMNCPGSVALSEKLPDVPSAYAAEGTAAHEAGEKILRTHWYINPNTKGLVNRDGHTPVHQINGIDVTYEMLDAVQAYVDYCRQHTQNTSTGFLLEHRFSLDMLGPPAPMYGTADFIAYHPGEWIEVVDYKHGAGIAVDVEDNPQLRYYGLGAYCALYERGHRFKTVRMTIVQPRAPHSQGPIRTTEMPVEDLLDWGFDLMAAAAKTLDPDAPRVTGKQCRFCKALAQCPTAAAQATSMAQTEFPVESLPLVTDEGLASLMDAIEDWVSAWVKAVELELFNRMEAGSTMPGWKLVPKRAQRKWTDEAAFVHWAKENGLVREQLYDESLRSVAQMEKVVGKGKLPAELVKSESSGNTVARSKDPRQTTDGSKTGGEFFE